MKRFCIAAAFFCVILRFVYPQDAGGDSSTVDSTAYDDQADAPLDQAGELADRTGGQADSANAAGSVSAENGEEGDLAEVLTGNESVDAADGSPADAHPLENSPLRKFSPAGFVAEGHTGRVNAVSSIGRGLILSGGEDGCIGIWSLSPDVGNANLAGASIASASLAPVAVERFKVSESPVLDLKLCPEREECALIISDELGVNLVAVWNYITKTRIFSVDFGDPVVNISYSPKGSFIVVSLGGRGMVALLDAKTGKIFDNRAEWNTAAGFTAVSRSERVVLVYSPRGLISYRSVETGDVTLQDGKRNEFKSAVGLKEPVLFGNYSFLSGFDGEGLVVLNAVNGRVVARVKEIAAGKLFAPGMESAEFYCVSARGGASSLIHYDVGRTGELAAKNIPLGTRAGEVSAACAVDGSTFVIANTKGELFRVSAEGGDGGGTSLAAFAARAQTRVLDALAIDDGTILLGLDAGQTKILAEVPADYRLLLEDAGIRQGTDLVLRNGEFPRAVLGDRALYVNDGGRIRVTSLKDGRELFSTTLPLTQDACFVNEVSILVARTAASGGGAFLLVNTRTGETVPVSLPYSLALHVQRGASGNIYAAVLKNVGSTIGVIKLDLADSRNSRLIVEGGADADEGSILDFAEVGVSGTGATGGRLFCAMGGAAAFYPQSGRGEAVPAERDGGLPYRLLSPPTLQGTPDTVILVDTAGSLLYIESASGKIKAVLRFQGSSFELVTADGATSRGKM